MPSSGCHHLIARNSGSSSLQYDLAFSFGVTFGGEVVASWEILFSFKSVSFGDECIVCQDDESLVEIYWDRERTEASYPALSWSLDEEATGSVLEGTLSWKDTRLKYYRECIAASTCATLRATVPETYDILAEQLDGSFKTEAYGETNALHVQVDGVIFAEKYDLGSHVEQSPFTFLLPIGECTLEHATCDIEAEQFLDISVTTGSSDVFGGFRGNWFVRETYEIDVYGFTETRDRIVLDSSEMFGGFLADTTYRTYQCLPKSSNYTDLFLEDEGLLETYTVRLDEKVFDTATECSTFDGVSCPCIECSRTHLFGDCGDSQMRGEIIGIIGGVLGGFFALVIFAGWWWWWSWCTKAGRDAKTAEEAGGSKTDEHETVYEVEEI